ncbi:hypothetical protein [Phenylobacterium montanum]|uniref:Uncharacterized protein n=1 Tax=Phenylobacterium montanum TaxID=2823693 RepID=A0A975G3H2_9CAUL|nr:hypothetical protein [Caulobacter sp. S6]QUD89859.1 hypothetical protein KCG34_08310 [Caulobacter sp. S6]
MGMAISELNVELEKLGPKSHPAMPDQAGGWLGAGGPFNLDVQLSAGTLHVPVSEHGGLQLVTSRNDLDFIQADLAPQPLDAAEAHRVAERLCIRAREAGLTTELATRGLSYGGDGKGVCSIRDRVQAMGVWIDRFQLEENGKYRVLFSVSSVGPH